MIRQVFISGGENDSPNDQKLLASEAYSGRLNAIFLFEFFYPPGCINDPLFSRQERVALGTDLYLYVFLG